MTKPSQGHAITPDAKVGPLLEEYPQLEGVLIAMSPAFGHLRNPVLRRTVAKVATLRQVAKIGNVDLGVLVNRLRESAGIKETWAGGTTPDNTGDAPAWLDKQGIVKTFDARSLIAGGGHPLEAVLSELKDLKAGEVFELLTPFLPAPLLDIVRKKGYEVWTDSRDGVFRNYMCRP